MIDNLFNKKSATETQKPMLSPLKPVSLSGPIGVAQNSNTSSTFQSVVEEAAIIFASGDEATAADMLTRFLINSKGNADRRVWFMLLDVFHAMGKRGEFDKIALNYAQKFGASPPSWDATSEALTHGTTNGSGAGQKNTGDNILILEGALRGDSLLKIKAFISAAKATKTCKIDISRLKMEHSDVAGLSSLLNAMKDMRKYRVAATLMGENHVAKWLLTKITEAKETKDRQFQTHWLLYLEILQWRGVKEEFEDLSFEYTMAYEESGPDYRDNEVMTIETTSEIDDDSSAASDESIVLQGEITQNVLNKLMESMNSVISSRGKVRIDFNNVLRMDFSTAGMFSTTLAGLGLSPQNIIITGASEPIVALMDLVGVSSMVSFVPRKR